MDALDYKLASPSLVPWPGTSRLVGLRPLPSIAVQRAMACEDALGPLADKLATVPRCAVLASALVDPEPPHAALASYPQLVAALTPDEATHLFAAWVTVQRNSTPDDADNLQRTVKRQMLDGGAVLLDGICATNCDTPDQFYGAPSAALTDGQLTYFFIVRAAYHELYLDGGGHTRCIARQVHG